MFNIVYKHPNHLSRTPGTTFKKHCKMVGSDEIEVGGNM